MIKVVYLILTLFSSLSIWSECSTLNDIFPSVAGVSDFVNCKGLLKINREAIEKEAKGQSQLIDEKLALNYLNYVDIIGKELGGLDLAFSSQGLNLMGLPQVKKTCQLDKIISEAPCSKSYDKKRLKRLFGVDRPIDLLSRIINNFDNAQGLRASPTRDKCLDPMMMNQLDTVDFSNEKNKKTMSRLFSLIGKAKTNENLTPFQMLIEMKAHDEDVFNVRRLVNSYPQIKILLEDWTLFSQFEKRKDNFNNKVLQELIKQNIEKVDHLISDKCEGLVKGFTQMACGGPKAPIVSNERFLRNVFRYNPDDHEEGFDDIFVQEPIEEVFLTHNFNCVERECGDKPHSERLKLCSRLYSTNGYDPDELIPFLDRQTGLKSNSYTYYEKPEWKGFESKLCPFVACEDPNQKNCQQAHNPRSFAAVSVTMGCPRGDSLCQDPLWKKIEKKFGPFSVMKGSPMAKDGNGLKVKGASSGGMQKRSRFAGHFRGVFGKEKDLRVGNKKESSKIDLLFLQKSLEKSGGVIANVLAVRNLQDASPFQEEGPGGVPEVPEERHEDEIGNRKNAFKGRGKQYLRQKRNNQQKAISQQEGQVNSWQDYQNKNLLANSSKEKSENDGPQESFFQRMKNSFNHLVESEEKKKQGEADLSFQEKRVSDNENSKRAEQLKSLRETVSSLSDQVENSNKQHSDRAKIAANTIFNGLKGGNSADSRNRRNNYKRERGQDFEDQGQSEFGPRAYETQQAPIRSPLIGDSVSQGTESSSHRELGTGSSQTKLTRRKPADISQDLNGNSINVGEDTDNKQELTTSGKDLINLDVSAIEKAGISIVNSFVLYAKVGGKVIAIHVKPIYWEGKNILRPILSHENKSIFREILRSPLFKDYIRYKKARSRSRR